MRGPIPVHDVLVLMDAAGKMARVAGFRQVFTSCGTESCYYSFPGRTGLLRISCHSTRKLAIGLVQKVVAKITIVGNCHDRPGTVRMTEDKLDKIVALAIGTYMLRTGTYMLRTGSGETTKIDIGA